MKPGDIRRVILPDLGGREQMGQRPGIILQDEVYGSKLPVVIVIPLTSVAAASRFAGTMNIIPTPLNGLQKPSVALVFQIRAVDRNRIGEPFGRLDDHLLVHLYMILGRLVGRSL